jgi:hypothetical protein
VHSVSPTPPEYVAPHNFWILQRNPADEAGMTCFGLLFDDYQGLVLFTDRNRQAPVYSRGFDIEFYGSDSRKEFLMNSLYDRTGGETV